jgi:Tfp pilus tip-associated adhesin PilY1
VKLDADIANHAFFSRGSPVVKANVIYSGFYETPAADWLEKNLRGHLSVTRLYAPSNPDATAELALWDAGAVLSASNPASRTIYFPQISTGQMSDLPIGTGDGTAKTFTGTISPVPISATTLTITDGRESFRDKHTDVLEGSLGGTGTINRFTGAFSLTFNEAPNNGAVIRASYTYYAAASGLKPFAAAYINKAVLGLDDSALVPSGFVYDFDKNNVVDDNDAHWLMNWVRGYELGTTIKREWLLDAVDHSVPALETAPGLPLWYFGTATTEQERTSYDQFMADQAARRAVVYVGSRSGMLHAFDAGAFRYGNNPDTAVTEHRGYFASADYGTGAELWAFIPANLMPRLKNNLLARQNKARAADYDQGYVDASPALADVYINGAWRTVLLSAEGNGGDTVFCLDVTNPASPSFLWEFADPDLFRSRSSPSVAKIGRIISNGTAKWVAFFVSGNDSRYDYTQYPSVYVIDIATGAVLQRVFLNAEALGIGGVPSGQPTIVDSDGNGYIDRFYIGTDKGFLYKVNIPDDPSSVKYAITHCVVNKDYSDVDGNTIASDRRYQPIYGSPVVVVNNTINESGGMNYNVKIFYGTGDSPYYAEDINMAGTRYHFLAYVDTARKGVCSDAAVSLDWYYELPEGHRVFASAFAAAGMIYFGTSTAETEDPCATDSQTNNNGEIFAIAINQPTNSVTPAFHQRVGNTVVPPLVEDQHLYIKNQSGGMQSFGSGRYNNEVLTGGFPQIKVKMWREIF